MSASLVSILIPFKNTAAFLPECLNSIVSQSYPHWEVLAVDDHSSDGSKELVASFGRHDARFRVLENEGNGIIEALRTAWASSKGGLITRMDSDDIMYPDRLKIMVNSLLNYGRGHLATGQVKYFSDQGISDGYARYERWLNALTSIGANYSEIYKECVIPSPCWMVHRKDFYTCGAFSHDRYPEDYDLAFRFYESGLRCIPCTHVLHLWRDYPSRTSRTSEHYAQNYFLDIKLHYFLKLDYSKNRVLAVWGAGTKGKTIARQLTDQKVPFIWLCDNPRKIGKKIYGRELCHFSALSDIKRPQSIITVANEEAQQMIRDYLRALGHDAMTDYFFFC